MKVNMYFRRNKKSELWLRSILSNALNRSNNRNFSLRAHLSLNYHLIISTMRTHDSLQISLEYSGQADSFYLSYLSLYSFFSIHILKVLWNTIMSVCPSICLSFFSLSLSLNCLSVFFCGAAAAVRLTRGSYTLVTQ